MVYYTSFGIPELKRTFFIAKNENGVCNIYFDKEGISVKENEKRFLNTLEQYNDAIIEDSPKLKKEIKEILEYFAGKRKEFTMKVDIPSAGFRGKVYDALAGVEYGELISYSGLAKKAGRPLAVRAAATSCAVNPLPVVVPCHRVVAKNGIGGFGGGLELKKFMLRLEGSLDEGFL